MDYVSAIGLVLFILAWVIEGVLLVDDGYIVLRGRMTWSRWATQPGKKYRAYLLIAGVWLGAIGFTVHLLF